MRTQFLFLFFLCFSFALTVFAIDARAQEEGKLTSRDVFRSTQYPLPRYVSLSSDEVNVRTGPGRNFPVKWVLQKKGLPVEIILEYDVWRKIKDIEGQEGWVHKSLLSGTRTAIADNMEAAFPLLNKPGMDAKRLAVIEVGVMGYIEECQKDWCEVSFNGYEGWIPKDKLWGVYAHEVFD